jgi:hypothetical protein
MEELHVCIFSDLLGSLLVTQAKPLLDEKRTKAIRTDFSDAPVVRLIEGRMFLPALPKASEPRSSPSGCPGPT